MKKYILLLALAILAFGCKKFNGKDSNELRAIAFPQPSYEVEAGKSAGFELVLTPRSAKAPKVKYTSTNSGIATVNGNSIVGVAVGTATIRAEVKDDPSIYCECSVTVVPANNAVQITYMTLTKPVLDIADLSPEGTADWQSVGVTLEPAEAGWDDVNVYSEDSDVYVEKLPGDPLQLKVFVTPNPEHNDTDCRSVLLHLKALKGNVEETIHVNICGHIKSLSVPRLESNDHFVSNKTVRYARGLTFSTGAQFEYTGNNFPSRFMANLVKFSSDNVELLTVDNAGKFSIPAGAAVTGNTNPVHVTLSVGFGVPDVTFPVYTYEKPTSYTYDIHKDDNHLLVDGGEYILSITASPENSLCWISVPNPPSEISDVAVTNMNNNKAKIEFQVIKSSSGEVTISPNAPIKAIQSWKFYADDFLATQPKPGDYVYYDPTLQNKYTWSNGGLLSLTGPRWSSNNVIAPVSGLGTLIGIIYDTFEYTSFPIKLAGLSGKHFKVVSIKDATVGGDNGEGTGKWPWTSYTFDLNDRWNGGSSTLPDGYKSNTYQINQAIIAYNDSQSDSHYRIRAIYSAQALGDSGSDRLPVAVGTASSIGSTGWMIPLKQDAEDLVDKKAIIERSGNTSGGVKNFVTGTEWYWTGSFKDGSYAYNFNASGVSYAGRSLHYTTRPILFL